MAYNAETGKKANVLFIQSFSKNIYQLNDLTFHNHIKYFNMHEYSFLFVNEPYCSGLFDFIKVKKYLENYDIVVTLGCDCLITNFEIPIESFSDNYIVLSQESLFSRQFGTYCNGEILIFNRKDDKVFEICDKLQLMQEQQQQKFIDANPNPPVGYFYSTQSLFNNIFENQDEIIKFITYIDIGKLQSYINDYVAITVMPDEEWHPGRFLMHVFGVPNFKKFIRLNEFLNKYPEYR